MNGWETTSGTLWQWPERRQVQQERSDGAGLRKAQLATKRNGGEFRITSMGFSLGSQVGETSDS